MKIKSPNPGQLPQKVETRARRALQGFAMSEVLLVVALVSVVSTISLRSFANQKKADMKIEALAEAGERRDAATWFATHLPDGSLVWTREF